MPFLPLSCAFVAAVKPEPKLLLSYTYANAAKLSHVLCRPHFFYHCLLNTATR